MIIRFLSLCYPLPILLRSLKERFFEVNFDSMAAIFLTQAIDVALIICDWKHISRFVKDILFLNHLDTAKYTAAILFRRIFHSSVFYPLSIRLLSVKYLFAIPSFINPFALLSRNSALLSSLRGGVEGSSRRTVVGPRRPN